MTVRRHTCHAHACGAPCPPAHLFCRPCWALVSPTTQAEVYRTVKLRGRAVDETWAPWWRAQAQAGYENAIARGLDGHAREDAPPWSAKAYLDKELAFAAKLEAM